MYVFSFVSEGATFSRFKQFKRFLADRKVKHSEEMIIHDIRKIVLREVHSRRGVDEARILAQHANMATTFNHYLDMQQDRHIVPLIEFKAGAVESFQTLTDNIGEGEED